MKPAAKVALIAGGYVAAWLAAKAVVAIHGAGRHGAEAMNVFGDSLYFLAAFGLVALIPTAVALISLRPYPRFWLGLTITGVTLATSGLLAVTAFLLARGGRMGPFMQTAAGLSVIRILAAPLVTLLLLVAGVTAPTRGWRIALLVSAAVECVGFACVATVWSLGLRF
ncbi:MAG TPA: hypothetical protein VFV19_15980 [Candidatus Polarisedimenticolaceae bacterium]|nr:hypothetical protein [Candidatus Polarisedimenticolaceae bacterium]